MPAASQHPFIAVICGLKSEAKAVEEAVANKPVRVGVSGADAGRAEKLAAEFCEQGAAAVVSAGVSGGLDPDLKPGDLLIGETVVTADGAVYASDIYLMRALKQAKCFETAKVGALFGADEIVDSVEKKTTIFADHKALAVDMESHGAARAAVRAGVPFVAIRAVADPADRALPEAALYAVAEDGSTRALMTLARAMGDPKQFPGLVKLGADSATATKTLRRDLGPLFLRLFRSLNL